MEKMGLRGFPGPGGHTPDFNAVKNSGPKYGIGREKRRDLSNTTTKTPGPGNYTIPVLMGHDGAVRSSMAAKLN